MCPSRVGALAASGAKPKPGCKCVDMPTITIALSPDTSTRGLQSPYSPCVPAIDNFCRWDALRNSRVELVVLYMHSL